MVKAYGKVTGVNLKGIEALIRKLKTIEEKSLKKAVRPALRRGAKYALALAQARAPYKTGALKRNLKVKATKAKKYRFGAKVVMPERRLLNLPTTGRSYYPAVFEFGSPKRNIRAMRYLRSAKKDAEPKVIHEVKKAVVALLRLHRYAKKSGRR